MANELGRVKLNGPSIREFLRRDGHNARWLASRLCELADEVPNDDNVALWETKLSRWLNGRRGCPEGIAYDILRILRLERMDAITLPWAAAA